MQFVVAEGDGFESLRCAGPDGNRRAGRVEMQVDSTSGDEKADGDWRHINRLILAYRQNLPAARCVHSTLRRRIGMDLDEHRRGATIKNDLPEALRAGSSVGLVEG